MIGQNNENYTPYSILLLDQLKNAIGGKIITGILSIAKKSIPLMNKDLSASYIISEEEITDAYLSLAEINTIKIPTETFERSVFDQLIELDNKLKILQEKTAIILSKVIDFNSKLTDKNSKNLVENLIITNKLLNESLTKLNQLTNIFHRPIGTYDMLWIVNTEIAWMKKTKKDNTTKFETDYLKTLNLIKEKITLFHTSNEVKLIEEISKHISDLDQKAQTEDDRSLLKHLSGINTESKVLTNSQQVLTARNRLDQISGELISNTNKINLEYKKTYYDLRKKYKIKEKNKKNESAGWFSNILKGIKSFFSVFNIAQSIREYQFSKKIHDVAREHKKALAEAKQKHQSQYQAEQEQLSTEIKFHSQEIGMASQREISSAGIPLSFMGHQNIKEAVTLHGGIMIAGISQSRILSMGSSEGLCYGLSKEWLIKLSELSKNDQEDYALIDSLNMYAKKIDADIDIFSNPVNNLQIGENTYQHHSEQITEKDKTPDGKHRAQYEIDNNFPDKIFIQLKISPFCILNLKNNMGGHAIGVARTKHGLWFHDSNFCCAYFPNTPSEEKMQENFKSFFNEHYRKNYRNLNTGSFVSLDEKISVSNESTFVDALKWSHTHASTSDKSESQKTEAQIENNLSIKKKKDLP